MWPPPLSCLARLNVSTTNWLPTGIQGAKEPLDGQRLEVYPGINVSQSVCDTQESSLFIRARYKGTRQISSLPTSAHLSVHSALLLFLQWLSTLEVVIRTYGSGHLGHLPDPFIKWEGATIGSP